MKRLIIVFLACLNVALLGALLFVGSPKPAEAQVIGAGTDYAAVTGTGTGMGGDAVVYVVDVGKQAMLAWRYDKGQKMPVRFKFGADLSKDLAPDGR